MQTINISPQDWQLSELAEAISQPHQLVLSKASRELVQKGRQFLETKLRDTDHWFYGINTGFGDLCNQRIAKEDIIVLQANLLKSHACGAGEVVPDEVVRLIILLKIKSLAAGNSGVREELLDRLIHFYNEGVLPRIYQLGSLGASGDLAPLAHLGLALLGIGDVVWQGEVKEAKAVLSDLGLEPLALEAKEGLAILNGTQFSTAYLLWAYCKGEQLAKMADMIGALSCDAFACRLDPFDARIHQIRPHAGQIRVAARIREILSESPLATVAKEQVQDPYSFRCMPQVHGASQDVLSYVAGVLSIELNAVTDNPNLFPDSDGIISGGNFHAQPIALAADYLAIALAEFGNISERRCFHLLSGKRELPPFLSPYAGLHSGFMIPQYTAASIVSQNKQYCSPASVDSIVSSNGQEDHVSMAANAGTKLYKVVENVAMVLAIEFMCAAQALDLRRPSQTSPFLEEIVRQYRLEVSALEEDRYLYPEMQRTMQFLLSLTLSLD